MKKKNVSLSDMTASPSRSSGLRKPKRKTMRFLSRYKANAPVGFGRRVLFLGLPTIAGLMVIAVLVVQIKLSMGRQTEVKFEMPDKNQFELDQLSEQEMGRDLDPGEIAVLAELPKPTEAFPETAEITEETSEPSLLKETQETIEAKIEVEVKTVYANTVLNYRASPATEGARLGQLAYGEAVQQISEENGWAQIKTKQGVEGYALAKYLQDSKPAPRTVATTEATTQRTASETTSDPNVITPQTEAPSTVRYVNVDMANIRTEPDENAARVGFAQRGTVINIISVEGDWAKVKTESGMIGYMSTKLYQTAKIEKVVDDINMGVDNWVQVNYGYLRAEATTDSEAIASVRLNDKVFQISTDGIWSKVRLANGQEGYIRNDLLTTVKPVVPEPEPEPEPESDYRDTNVSVYVIVAYANLRSSDSTSSAIAGAATLNEKLTQLSTNGSWSKIKTKNGLVAYISNGLISKEAPGGDDQPGDSNQSGDEPSDGSSFKEINKDAWVRVNAANVRKEPNTSSAKVTTLSLADKVTQLASDGTWSKIRMSNDKEGYILNTLISSSKIEKPVEPEPEPETDSKTALRKQVVEKAKSALGVRYVFGGASMSGFDCSGLTMWVYNSVGYKLPHGSNSQGHNYVRNVSFSPNDYSNVKIGDLVFFGKTAGRYSHVGIYIGDGKMIHAPQPGKSVEIQVISSRSSSNQPTKIGRVIN